MQRRYIYHGRARALLSINVRTREMGLIRITISQMQQRCHAVHHDNWWQFPSRKPQICFCG